MSVNLYVKSNRGKVEANVQKGGGGQQTDNAVLYTEQFLTDAQKAQARTNIGAPSFSDIPAKTSKLQNDSGFITESALAPYAQKTNIQTVSGSAAAITPETNTIYQCGELTSLTIANPPADGMYVVIFTSGATPTTTTIPTAIHGFDDFAAEANMRYEINVLNNYALIAGWEVTV